MSHPRPAAERAQARYFRRLRHGSARRMQRFRDALVSFDAIPQLALLGVLSGLLTGGVILLFRLTVEGSLALLLPQDNPENFEGLATWERFLLPLTGALVIALTLRFLPEPLRRMGIVHVMERLNSFQGYLSLKNLLVQFWCGCLTLISGQSAGREGPSVHLGACSSSLLGQWLGLPNNSIRMLVGCGAAGAISAAFHTPIAGVIFAMEVVIMDYTINSFMPVILAAVVAALVNSLVYGNEAAFILPAFEMNSIWETPYVVALGLAVGISSSTFVRLMLATRRHIRISLTLRILAAGALVGGVALFFPQVMGLGYDTVNLSISGALGLQLLLILAAAKLVLTSVSIGLGMPCGLIGPALFIGACIGGAFGLIAQTLMPTLASEPGFYAVIGMGAMMGSLLQAPLAAIIGVIELTQSAHLFLPAMLAVICSSTIAAHFFGQKGVFLEQLQAMGLDYRTEPIVQALRRQAVGAVMDDQLARIPRESNLADLQTALAAHPRWLVIDERKQPRSLLPASDLSRHLEKMQEEEGPLPEDAIIDLMQIPAQRLDVDQIKRQATLEEALLKLNETGVGALCVVSTPAPGLRRIDGIVTRQRLENHYQLKN